MTSHVQYKIQYKYSFSTELDLTFVMTKKRGPRLQNIQQRATRESTMGNK